MGDLQHLIEISRHYGARKNYVIAGGGNTSCKVGDRIWIKASGIPLAGIDGDGFVSLSRPALDQLAFRYYSEDPITREEQVKKDITKAVISPENLRPSVETSLHNLIPYVYVVHTHPTLVNALMCSNRAAAVTEDRFGSEALYMEYTDPGHTLFRALRDRIAAYGSNHGHAPQVIFLQNHGVFVAADSVEEIERLYREIEQRIGAGMEVQLPDGEAVDYDSEYTGALASHFRSASLHLKAVRCPLTDHFTASYERFKKISQPFTPDVIVYCKSNYLFLKKGLSGETAVTAAETFENTYSHYPKVILEEDGGLMVVEEDPSSLQTVLDVYLDLMKISFLSENFGGPHFMTRDQIRFIDNWEVENYRRRMAKSAGKS